MDLRNKIFGPGRRIFGKRSQGIRSLGGGSRSDSLIEGDGRNTLPTTAKSTVMRDDSAAPIASHSSDSEHNNGTTEATQNHEVEKTGPDSRQQVNRQLQANEGNTHSIAMAQEIRHNKPTISDNPSLELTPGTENENNPVSVIPDLAQPPVAMIDRAKNLLITGGNFTQQNTINMTRRGLEFLQQRVATAAFHNSAQRVDPPRCHPDTRVAILQSVYDWIIQSENRREWLLWLNGAAGAGKSAIMQSIAEQCSNATIRLAVASFFFFRADPTRNTMAHLVATLVYQLIQAVPELSNEILLIIERHPLIFDESLESQLQQLIIQPLLRLSAHLQLLFVMLVDGLDECDDRTHQSNLIKVFADIITRSRAISIVFVVASRREPQIDSTFVQRQISKLVLTLPLDNLNIEQTSRDIRHFLNDKFNEIKEVHRLRNPRLLPTDWPPILAVEEIVNKSSGQFIYASVVINYVSSLRANPSRQLDIVRGLRLRDPSSKNPFAHLDALYQHIFSQVEALPLDKLLDILAFILITENYYITHIELIFLLEAGELELYLSDLAAIIECEHPDSTPDQPKIKFLHASLPDFLLDESRSERYHINIDEYRTKLLCMFLERNSPQWKTQNIDIVSTQMSHHLSAIRALLEGGAKASDRLQHSFANFKFTSPRRLDGIDLTTSSAIVILSQLKELSFDDKGEAYRHVSAVLAVEIAQNWHSVANNIKNHVKETPDLFARIINEIATSAIAILSQLKESSSDDPSQSYRHVLDVLVVEIAENWQLVAKNIKSRVKETPDLFARIINEIATSAIRIVSQLKESGSDDLSQSYRHVVDVLAVEIAQNWHLVAKHIKSHVKETPDLFARIINEISISAIVIVSQLKELSSNGQSQTYRQVLDILTTEIAENWHLVAKDIKNRMKKSPHLLVRIINKMAILAIVIVSQLKGLSSDDPSQSYRHVLDVLAVEIAENWHLVAKNIKSRVKETPDLFTRIINKMAILVIVIVSQLELNSGDHSQAYRRVLDVLTVEIAESWPLVAEDTKSRVKKIPELLACISQIRREEI